MKKRPDLIEDIKPILTLKEDIVIKNKVIRKGTPFTIEKESKK